ncbi:hypothetical protein ACH4SP_01120 [Streptomyces sp. NPDC021093]
MTDAPSPQLRMAGRTVAAAGGERDTPSPPLRMTGLPGESRPDAP